jgi:hypothetical protein
MRLVPFNDYVVRAEKFTAENPLGAWKRAFLSTEDPNVIEQMKIMARITPFSYSGSNSRLSWDRSRDQRSRDHRPLVALVILAYLGRP